MVKTQRSLFVELNYSFGGFLVDMEESLISNEFPNFLFNRISSSHSKIMSSRMHNIHCNIAKTFFHIISNYKPVIIPLTYFY